MHRLIFILLITSTACYGQIEDCTHYKQDIDLIVSGTDRAVDLVSIEAAPRCFLIYAAGEPELTLASFEEYVRRLEASRPDKQSGAGANSSGSTSVVAQGPVAKALSLATEYGALSQSTSGQVVTVRGNLAGLPSALVRQNIFPYCVGNERLSGYCVNGSLIRALSHISFGISFDTTRNDVAASAVPASSSSSTAQPVTFTGKKREISSLSAHFEILNRRDVTSKEFQQAWAQKVGAAMDSPALDLLDTAGSLTSTIVKDSDYASWRTRSLARLRSADRDREKIVAALKESLQELISIFSTKIPNLREKAAAAVAAYSGFFLAQDDLIDSLAKKTVIAVEYTNNRPVGQAEVHNLRLIWDQPFDQHTKVVANGALDFYNSIPSDATANVKRFRDAQFGIQMDHGLDQNTLKSPATISLAGYYQYQNTPTVLEVGPANPIPGISFTNLPANTQTVFTKSGNIFLAQAKLTLAPTATSTKIPLSIRYSNRTELINRPTWRAQVGVTYDFDSLLSGLAKH
jgi:hypothetical protein